MLVATILLLCPFPQTGDVGRAVVNTSEVVSDSTKDSSPSRPLPPAPEPKIKTDAAAGVGSALGNSALLASPDPIGPHYGALPIEPVKSPAFRPHESPRERKMWYALAFAGHGAAGFDAWSTRRAISQGYGTEANPLLRPFAHSGMLYAATQASPALMDFIGKRMMTNQHKWVRRMWWLPQSAGTAMSLAAGVHNVGVVP